MAFSLFNFLGFYGKTGAQLIDAADLTKLTNYTMGILSGIIALAGGAQAGSPVLAYGNNEIDTVVTANDSVQMPPAIAGAFVTINNNGANTTKVYASPAPNAANASALDQICIHGTTALTANATAITVSSGYYTEFTCYVTGVWKQSAAPS